MTDIDPFTRPPAAPPGRPQVIPPPAPAVAHQMPPQPAPAIPQPARRPPVNYQPNEAGWWLASDGLWYPPESQSALPPPPPPSSVPFVSNPSGHAQTVIVQVGPQPYPGWTPAPPPPPMMVTGPPRSKSTAALLAFFLGALGIHRFYLGNNGIGVAMLLVSLLSFGILAPVVMIWALVEMIVILTGGMRDAQGRDLV